MRWQVKNMENPTTTAWHKWFAWYPVYVGKGTWVWLQHVYRKGVGTGYAGTVDWKYEIEGRPY